MKLSLNLFYNGTEQRGSDCLECDTGRRTRQEGSDRAGQGRGHLGMKRALNLFYDSTEQKGSDKARGE